MIGQLSHLAWNPTRVLLATVSQANGIRPRLFQKQRKVLLFNQIGLTRWLNGKESTCNEGDPVRSPGWEDSLEKGMTTHFSILAWRIPQTEDPGKLQSMGSQRVGHI